MGLALWLDPPSPAPSGIKLHDILTLVLETSDGSQQNQIAVEVTNVAADGTISFEGRYEVSGHGKTLVRKVRGKVPADCISANNKVKRRDVLDFEMELKSRDAMLSEQENMHTGFFQPPKDDPPFVPKPEAIEARTRRYNSDR
jgi:hypothetical protein